MKNNNDLVVITYEYPYGNNETFVDNEIKYLTAAFRNVFIIPARRYYLFNGLKNKDRSPQNIKFCKINTIWFLCSLLNIKQFMKIVSLADNIATTENHYILKLKLLLVESLKTHIIYSVLRNINISLTNKIIYSYWKNEVAIALSLLRYKGHIKNFITRCHGQDLYLEQKKYSYSPFESFLKEQVPLVVPISSHGEEYLLRMKYSRNRIILSRLGVRLPKRVSEQSATGPFQIVSCSSMIPLKRLDLIASSLASINFPIFWTHIGDGSEEYNIKKIVNDTKMSNCVLLLGKLSYSDVFKFYNNNSIDMFINVSSTEGVPVSIMEALAFGIPCLATNVGGVSEIVNDNNGLLVDNNINSKELAGIINKIISNNNVWINKRSYARNFARHHCNDSKNYKNFISILGKYSN
jgi:glycosyltransferase involved in cell wall biosynthesis